MENPKLFISYSWSSPEREEWVIQLATELSENGVDVSLDKWDLKQGHDAIAFMEGMVNDPEIKKVIMVVDKAYADKSNNRAGGVGTEAQIISAEVYAAQKQDEFVAIVVEKDDSGKIFLPTYYKSRIYIDFTDSYKYPEKFEELLRWVYDKPIHQKPQIGNPPSYIKDGATVLLPTASYYKRLTDAIHNAKPNWFGALKDYFRAFSTGLENFRIKHIENEIFDDAVIASIEAFLLYREELLNVINSLSNYQINGYEYASAIHSFLESLIPYQYRPENINSYRETDFDNFKFIINEIFVSVIAVLLKNEKFVEVNTILNKLFYLENYVSRYGESESYLYFRHYVRSINEIRNNRLGLRRLSLHADLLSKRYEHSIISFREYMQSDFILYLRAEIQRNDSHKMWFPNSLLYTTFNYSGAFEVFSRARAANYFEKFRVALGIERKTDLDKFFESIRLNQRYIPKWDYHEIPIRELVDIDKIATLP